MPAVADRVSLRYCEEETFGTSPNAEATGLTLTTTQSSKKYAAAAGLDVFSVGQTVLIAGLVNSASNGYKTVVSASATELVVEEAIGANEAAVAGCSIKTAYNELRFTGEQFGQTTVVEESDEIRDDRQVADVKRSSVSAGGEMNFELSYGMLDDLLEAALMSADWPDVVTDEQTTFSMDSTDNSINDSGSGFVAAGFLANQWIKTSGFATAANNGYFKIVSITAGKMVLAGGTVVTEAAGATDTQITFSMDSTDNSINDSGSGFVAAGFVAGQQVKISGFTESANNGYFTLVSVTAGKMVLSGGTVVTEVAGDSVTVADTRIVTMGAQVVNGTTERFFSIERAYKDLTKYAVYNGMEVNALSLSVAAGGKITGSLGFMGKAETSSASSYSKGTAQAAAENDVMSAVDEVSDILEGMSSQSVKSLSLSLSNNLRERTVIGEVGPESFGAGRLAVSGSFEIYLADSTLLDKYLNQTASSISVIFEDAAGNAYIVDLPQIRYTDGKRVAGGKDTDIMAAVTFAAYRDETEDVTIRIARFAA
jgi:hypothetical protein